MDLTSDRVSFNNQHPKTNRKSKLHVVKLTLPVAKKNKQQKAQDNEQVEDNAAAQAEQIAHGEPLASDEEVKAEETPAEAPLAEKQAKASQDKPVAKTSLKRTNSKFQLQAGDDEQEKPLYRPEFGQEGRAANERIWELMSAYIGSDQKSIQRSIVNHVEYTLARTRFNFDNLGAMQAASHSVRDRLIEGFNDTQQYHTVSPLLLMFYRLKTANACTTCPWNS